MIKIEISDGLIEKFYLGVKDYINLDVLSDKAQKYFTPTKIKEIITCKPQNFDLLASEIRREHINLKKLKLAFVGTKKFSSGYTLFSSKSTKRYCAYDLSEELNINVCPYCNKNYTYTVVDKTGAQYTRPDFDHFLSKEKYPYFALSIYNLVPSCKICNQTLKGRKEFSLASHLHPYVENLHHIKKFITTKPLLLCEKIEDFEITFKNESSDPTLINKANQNIKDFALEVQYAKHKDIVLELKDKYNLYNDSSIKNILEETDIFKEKGELYIKRLAFGTHMEDENINMRPLSKLTKDILEQLEII